MRGWLLPKSALCHGPRHAVLGSRGNIGCSIQPRESEWFLIMIEETALSLTRSYSWPQRPSGKPPANLRIAYRVSEESVNHKKPTRNHESASQQGPKRCSGHGSRNLLRLDLRSMLASWSIPTTQAARPTQSRVSF